MLMNIIERMSFVCESFVSVASGLPVANVHVTCEVIRDT